MPSASERPQCHQADALENGGARSLLTLIGKDGNTVETIRELIEVPPRIDDAMRMYLRTHPEDARGIENVLRFQSRVREDFRP